MWFGLVLLIGGVHALVRIVSAMEDPNSVYCVINPCQHNGTCINMLRPGSDRSLSLCQDASCYKFILQEATWEEASTECTAMGASLVAMEATGETDLLGGFIKAKFLHQPIAPQEHHPGGFWTGGNDLQNESTWEWGTSGVLVEPLWYPLNHQHRYTTNCLMLNTDRTYYSDFRLLEADCQRKLYFVCELPKDLLFEERTFQCLCEDGYSGQFCNETSALQPQTEILCRNEPLEIDCGPGRLIQVDTAFFARTGESTVCADPNVVLPTDSCVFPNGLDLLLIEIVKRRCDVQRNCSIDVTEEIAAYDNCPLHKYATIKYSCVRDAHNGACETESAELSCQSIPERPYLRVTLAAYGRLRDELNCQKPTHTPATVPPSTDCRAITSLDIAAASCNGYHSCALNASFDMFGDPCTGIAKYLYVSYQCLSSFAEATASYPMTYGIYRPVYCPSTNHSGILWSRTEENRTDTQSCPPGQSGTATWLCVGDVHDGWDTSGPNITQCQAAWIADVYDQIYEGTVPINVLAETVLNNTLANTEPLDRDVIDSVALMEELVTVQETKLQMLEPKEQESEAAEFGEILLDFGSNLLDSSKQSTWDSIASGNADDAASSTTSTSPTSVAESMEDTGFLVAKFITENTSALNFESTNILMVVEAVPYKDAGKSKILQDTRKTEPGDGVRYSITFPPSATLPQPGVPQNKTASTEMVFLVYETLGEYLTDFALSDGMEDQIKELNSTSNETTTPVLNSAVVSASARNQDQDVKTFQEGEEALLIMKHTNASVNGNVTCVFWNASESLGRSGGGAWSDAGCRLVSSNQSHSVCACSHLTNFAILMDVSGTHESISDTHNNILTALTLIGCSVSIVCLAISIFAFTFFRNLWSLRVTIHRNLCINLLIANALFLVAVDKTQIKVLCSIVAGLLHYSFLAAFVWMSLEAIQFYVMLVHVFSTQSRYWPYYLAGYGVPAIIVGVSAGINPSGYGTDKYCWLSTEDYFIWSFTGPVAAIIVANVVLLIVSLHKAYSSRSSISKGVAQNNDIRPWIKGAATLLFLLGITWGVGFLFINGESLVFAYIFNVLNSLQGLFIFVFYCLGNERVNTEMRKCITRQKWLPSSIRERYGKHVSSTSTTSQAKGITASKRQKCRNEIYHVNQNAPTTKFTSTLDEGHMDTDSGVSFTNPVVNVQMVDDDVVTTVTDDGNNPNGEEQNVENNSWLYKDDGACKFAMTNKNSQSASSGMEYPEVDYE
ncbi:latrophilin-like protein LAT-2 [Asterias amurensis]|uniref:latrophilin-like protein LAT-2 n=1 Tax=Asterias amurensis TaxID=7602 RepID=UPI003AB7100E